MKTVQVELNDTLAEKLDALIKDGFFITEEEAIRFALVRLIASQEFMLAERFERHDIAWALKQKKAKS